MKSVLVQTVFIGLLFEAVLCEQNQLTIIKNEMPETIKEFSIGTALIALSESSDQNVIADKLSNALNSKYGPQWFSLVGPTGLVSHFDTQPNTLLNFEYGKTQILLFKLQSTNIQTNNSEIEYIDVVNNARKAVNPIDEYEWAVNSTMKDAIISAAKQGVDSDPKYLNCKPNYLVETHNCFFGLAIKVRDILEEKLKGRWSVDVGVLGNYESVVSKYLNYFSFRLANLHFKVNQMSTN